VASRSHPFVVPVAALRRTVGAARHEVCRGVIEGLAAGRVSGGQGGRGGGSGGWAAGSVSVAEGEPVVVDLTLSSYPGGIAAQGTVGAPWVGECRRCGGVVTSEVTVAVRERFTPQGGCDQEEGASRRSGASPTLEPMARDAVLLELPL